MARVTGLTAERMLAIEAASVVSGAVDLSGRLQLTTHGGDVIDAGMVMGPANTGPTGTVIMFAAEQVPVGWLVCDGSEVRRDVYPELFSVIGTTYGVGDNLTTFALPNLVGRVVVGQGGTGSYSAMGDTGGSETVTLTSEQMPVHTHAQDPHTHTQASHTHTQSKHGHTGVSHSHTSPAHDHSQTAHAHGADSGTLGWKTKSFSTGSAPGIAQNGEARSTTSVTANNGTTAVSISSNTAGVNDTTATNNTSTATNNSTTAVNKNAGGGAAHPNMQPYQVMRYLIKT